MNNGHPLLAKLPNVPVHRDWDVAIAPLPSPQLVALLELGFEPMNVLDAELGTTPDGKPVRGPVVALRKKNSPVHLA